MLSTILSLIPIATSTERLWYAVPLLVSFSLVYSATRHEEVVPILKHAFRFGLWVTIFMAVMAAIIQITTWTL